MPKTVFTEDKHLTRVAAWSFRIGPAQAGTSHELPSMASCISASCGTKERYIPVYVLKSHLLLRCQQNGADTQHEVSDSVWTSRGKEEHLTRLMSNFKQKGLCKSLSGKY